MQTQANPQQGEAEQDGVRVGEVRDDSGDDTLDPEAVDMFRNIGQPVLGQELGEPIIFQTGQPNGDGGQIASGVNANIDLVYYTSEPNLQTLQPIPPEQLAEEVVATSAPTGVPAELVLERVPQGEPPLKKERKKKEREGQAAEKRKLEDKSKRLQKQLQQQRADIRMQAAQAREAALARQAESAGEQHVPEPYAAPRQSVYVTDNRYPQTINVVREPPSAVPQAAVPQAAFPQAAVPQQVPPWNGQAAAWARNATPYVFPPQPQPPWIPPQGWQPQQGPVQGGWVWQQPPTQVTAAATQAKSTKTQAAKKTNKVTITEDSDESDSEEEDKERKKKEKEKNWEKETPKQCATRHKKYEKMSETTDNDKQSVKHQVGCMYKSVVAQEKVVELLRSLRYQGASEEQVQENKDLLEEVLAARKELVDRIQYLEVAHDYDWDAAKVFLKMREANPSSIVLKAVKSSSKRSVVGGSRSQTAF